MRFISSSIYKKTVVFFSHYHNLKYTYPLILFPIYPNRHKNVEATCLPSAHHHQNPSLAIALAIFPRHCPRISSFQRLFFIGKTAKPFQARAVPNKIKAAVDVNLTNDGILTGSTVKKLWSELNKL